MPELPEVETICRQLDPELAGRCIDELEIRDSKWSEPELPSALSQAVRGRMIEGLERRGKYLLLRLDRDDTLVIHLRMTGNLLLMETERAPLPGDPRLERSEDEERHLRARFLLDDEREVWFTDPRRFGRGFLAGAADLDAYFAARLGPEPFEEGFTPAYLAEVSRGRRQPLKSFLLDQARVAGIGNIYADEALYRARLNPLAAAGSLSADGYRDLRNAVVEALQAGIDHGGASIDDYRDGLGGRGTMQNEFLVHRREGQPCPECGTEITRIVVSGRSTYYCPSCQPSATA